MKIIKSNSELRDLRNQLKDAAESENLDLMKDLYDKIKKIHLKSKIKEGGARFVHIDSPRSHTMDNKTGLAWFTNGSTYLIDHIVRDMRNGGNIRLPTLEELKELFGNHNSQELHNLGFYLPVNPDGFYFTDASTNPSDDLIPCYSFSTKELVFVPKDNSYNYLYICDI